jgi:endonuclease/exonuclease/phosphatase family metal-dependent hydrolase
MRKLLFLLVVSGSALFGTVEHSIVPEAAQLYDQLDPKKYSTRQYQEIQEALAHKGERLRVATFNTLFDFYDETLPEPYKWPQRKGRVVEMIQHLQPDILGVQEVYPRQLADLMSGLEGYAFYGEPKKNGEINGIFYNVKRLKLLESRFMAPLNIVKLEDRVTGKAIAFCNTHLSFSKIDKREAEARAINKIISEYLLEEHLEKPPLVLVGDMNTFPNLPCLKKMPFLDGSRIERLLKGDILLDARECALLGHLGPLATFSNSEEDIAPFRGKGIPGVFLDHIYVTKDLTVLLHAVEPGLVDGYYPSDHFPLFADITIL